MGQTSAQRPHWMHASLTTRRVRDGLLASAYMAPNGQT
jgi:hypothetical protein